MTKPFFLKGHISSNQIWELAVQWVDDNKKLVRQIAAPYQRHMAADTSDLFQEATISAFNAINIVLKKEKSAQFTQFFRVIFRTNCIKLASGVRAIHCDINHVSSPLNEQEHPEAKDHTALNNAFNVMTKRQRQVCHWILNQPLPISTPDLAKQFKISRRHACRLVSSSLERISMVQK